MARTRPRVEAISLEQKQSRSELPAFRRLPQGGVLARNPETREEHTGVLPDLRGIECLPPTQPPVEELVAREAAFLEAVEEGCTGSLADEARDAEPYSPSTATPWGRALPAESYCPKKR